MNGLEAIETVNSWKRILIEGKAEQIDPMLADLERRLQDRGWYRDSDREAKMGRSSERKNRWLCFVGGPRDGARMMLCLARVSDRRVRGGPYSFLSVPPDMQPAEEAGIVEEVMKGILTPCASTFGLRVTTPRLGPKSRVPPRTMAALQSFSDSAAGVWPLCGDLESLWRRFVITACREDVAFDIDELSDWFVSNGWSSEGARGLTEQFMNEASLISEYNDSGSGQ
jgi:hypothetical protein